MKKEELAKSLSYCGLEASIAGTSLRNIFLELSKQRNKIKKQMKNKILYYSAKGELLESNLKNKNYDKSRKQTTHEPILVGGIYKQNLKT